MGVRSLCHVLVAILLGWPVLFAQQRTMAITVDDLPYASGSAASASPAAHAARARSVNRKLLSAFHARTIPVTGFVIERSVESLGAAGPEILKRWLDEGFDLGNHTYSHPDINSLSAEQIEEEIVRGETTIGPLIKNAGRRLEFFRFPMNHTGDTAAKQDALAEFLKRRGYRLAVCTIDNSDYLFNQTYVKILASKDAANARKLRRDYLAYTATEIEYYARLHRQVFGHEIPQVMLLHDNDLNADVIDQLLRIFVSQRYAFVSLDAALSDAAYQTPETYVTKFGPMWGYRWASELHVKVNGNLETEPPKWISEYGKANENGVAH